MKTMTYKDLKRRKQDFCRVSNQDAKGLSEMGWKYCPKKSWKRIVKDQKRRVK